MTRWLSRELAAPALAAALLTGGPARADLLVDVSYTGSGADTVWTYRIELGEGTQFEDGSCFTIYDFAGYFDRPRAGPAGWSLSVVNEGPDPPKVSPSDDP